MRFRRGILRLLLVALAACLLAAACTNDPFDPASVPNSPPSIRFFADPLDPDEELNPTSYYERTFHWSGSDRDGTVEEYHVSVRLDPAVPAPWDTTSRTDTTMTFVTDDEGNAEATFYLACRDDRGALSDTLVRRVPLRNFPPVISFQHDFEPLRNLQREFVYEGEAVVDTIYWNWGVMNLRLFAFDLDGRAAMDTFYRYTFAEEEPDEVRAWDDPLADPLRHWIAVPFAGTDEVVPFELEFHDLPAGERQLTVAVSDEAGTEARLSFDWVVRRPSSGVLLVPDNSSTTVRAFYREFAAEYLGPANWDEYSFWFGFPDRMDLFLETLRLFDLVFWFDGGSTSQSFQEAVETLRQYLEPQDGAEPGRLLLISQNLTGSDSDIPIPFRQEVLGVRRESDPPSTLEPTSSAVGARLLGAQPWLPALTFANLGSRGVGLDPLPGTEELYRFEECVGCFGPRPPYDPLIGVRRPDRDTSELARVVGFSYHLSDFDPVEARAALAAVFAHELGVERP
jgi:hypothetical protein